MILMFLLEGGIKDGFRGIGCQPGSRQVEDLWQLEYVAACRCLP